MSEFTTYYCDYCIKPISDPSSMTKIIQPQAFGDRIFHIHKNCIDRDYIFKLMDGYMLSTKELDKETKQ